MKYLSGIITQAIDRPAPLLRIAKAVAVACLYSYAFSPYSKIQEESGIVKHNSKA